MGAVYRVHSALTRRLVAALKVMKPTTEPDARARFVREAEALATTGRLGTLPSLPPEVFRGERADPAAIDVYGFGLLIHEALTGERAFSLEAGLGPAAASAAVGVRKLQAPALELPAQFPERLRDLVRRATDP